MLRRSCEIAVSAWKSLLKRKTYLAEVGYDPDFGARPLKRAIQRELQDPLALEVLSGNLKVGDLIQVEVGPEGLIFKPVRQTEIVAEI